MIVRITGTLIKKNADSAVIERDGIGFQLEMAPRSVAALPPVGEEVTVHTYMHVRENELALFGFQSDEEKKLFSLLQTVSGVGPKLALQVIDALTPEAFAVAILQNDVKKLTSVKGIGKKGAARMILEMTDKLKQSGMELPESSGGADTVEVDAVPAGPAEEAVAALVVLGYSQSEAREAVHRARPTADDTVETLLRRALGQLFTL
ncbi:MAG: Holliday junction branch migration protein RuvA [Saccharofermentanales bacterium]|jgi:Holliday junction DNA helicase RuvA